MAERESSLEQRERQDAEKDAYRRERQKRTGVVVEEKSKPKSRAKKKTEEKPDAEEESAE